MLLTHVVALALFISVLAASTYALLLRRSGITARADFPSHTAILAATATATVALFLCIRSLNFGVDTVAYVDLFDHYCNGGSLADVESSFRAATLLLNGLMLGSCTKEFLPATWIAALVLPVFWFAATTRLRLYYFAAFLLSIIGIELATNALRQGLSVGLMVIGVSLAHTASPSKRWLALPLAGLAALFHTSAVLFIAAYLLARLNWLAFLLVTGAVTWVTVTSFDAQLALPLASDFLYEIQKYAAHEGDELWIRVLAFACVLAALAAPVFVRGERTISQVMAQPFYAIAFRLSVLCVPFLALPYFGYRFIYGVYPMILFLSLMPASGEPKKLDQQALWLCLMNVAVLFAWSAGSSYMREVPFL
jgi:hypothetical protein